MKFVSLTVLIYQGKLGAVFLCSGNNIGNDGAAAIIGALTSLTALKLLALEYVHRLVLENILFVDFFRGC